jgi:hypothetical protein
VLLAICTLTGAPKLTLWITGEAFCRCFALVVFSMQVIFDNISDSFQAFVLGLFSYRWLSSDERSKLLALAPFMTEQERELITHSLSEESKSLIENL